MRGAATRGVTVCAMAATAVLVAAPSAAAEQSSQEMTGSSGSSAIGIVEVLSWAAAFLASALGLA